MGRKIFGFLRVMVVSYIITGVLLLILAYILYKWELSEMLMTIGSLLIYVLSCFFAGLFIGKSGRSRAFAWGMFAGIIYYLILLGIALLIPGEESASATTIFINMLICGASGMTGAMVFKK